MSTAPLEVIDLTPVIGAEIRMDRKDLVSGVAGQQLRAILQQRGVLVFKEVNLDDDEQLAVAASIGTIAKQLGDRIMKVTLDPNEPGTTGNVDYLKGSFFWHIDGATYTSPNFASLLTGRRLSATGGETQFASTYAAYDSLSDEEKASLEGVRVSHSLEAGMRYVTPEPSYAQLMAWREYPPRTHPLVWTHKDGRKSLLLGNTCAMVEDMDYLEGQALLCKLRDWATRPGNVYSHKWSVGDLVIWDNTGTMHRVTHFDENSGRLMRRVTLEGEEAVA
jgi:alpha-ketoglutarate-dependent taurine dioxygenase